MRPVDAIHCTRCSITADQSADTQLCGADAREVVDQANVKLTHREYLPVQCFVMAKQFRVLLSKTCANTRGVLFLSRTILLTEFVPDRRDFPDSNWHSARCSAGRYRPTRRDQGQAGQRHGANYPGKR
jgi:hypothetical protein